MTQLRDRIVCVTGASSGIGLATAIGFAREGARLLLVARRMEKLLDLASRLRNEFDTTSHCVQLDVSDREDVEHTFRSLSDEWSQIDILVNNAGLSRGLDTLQDGDPDDWEEMIDTNVKGLLFVTHEVAPGMIQRGFGHVINIGSIAGRQVYPKGNVYCATKYAVRALTEGMRIDFNGTPVRVSTVDPGLVDTEFSVIRFHGDEERAQKVYEGVNPLTAEDVAEAVVFCATRPAHVSIAEIVMLATDQASATMVHRRS